MSDTPSYKRVNQLELGISSLLFNKCQELYLYVLSDDPMIQREYKNTPTVYLKWSLLGNIIGINLDDFYNRITYHGVIKKLELVREKLEKTSRDTLEARLRMYQL